MLTFLSPYSLQGVLVLHSSSFSCHWHKINRSTATKGLRPKALILSPFPQMHLHLFQVFSVFLFLIHSCVFYLICFLNKCGLTFTTLSSNNSIIHRIIEDNNQSSHHLFLMPPRWHLWDVNRVRGCRVRGGEMVEEEVEWAKGAGRRDRVRGGAESSGGGARGEEGGWEERVGMREPGDRRERKGREMALEDGEWESRYGESWVRGGRRNEGRYCERRREEGKGRERVGGKVMWEGDKRGGKWEEWQGVGSNVTPMNPLSVQVVLQVELKSASHSQQST